MKHERPQTQSADGFSALSHETRLTVFQAIMVAGPSGLTAGELANRARVSPSNLSAHLNVLASSGLVTMRRDGRRRFYAARIDAVADLVRFFVEDCCNGHPEVYAQLSPGKLKSGTG